MIEKKSWRDLMPTLNALDREIGRAREREIGAVMDNLLQIMDEWSIGMPDLERHRRLHQNAVVHEMAHRTPMPAEGTDESDAHRNRSCLLPLSRMPATVTGTMKGAEDSQRVAAATRNRVQVALAAMPRRAGLDAVTFRARLFEGIRELANAWGGDLHVENLCKPLSPARVHVRCRTSLLDACAWSAAWALVSCVCI
ncbi:hypothetical protein [Burkholderia stagnalis]|uniref:hypothetical protein n=1 Tax=Burkholderia stagnalis TaxID=1503054 RepID=UPI001588D7B0|nr:hypothetical protein [Burkholderia stagnalis]